eukprot:TRINITY_DN48589_c0_g1_i1.p1 TRINITY_DN48589_c0_g1~~TRINITY_DN48589_c0_g1_i1.p1  ORF type:complete len:292 (-),score=44.82 TRINITY_DN48589_c0_g1_i1:61-936(-)
MAACNAVDDSAAPYSYVEREVAVVEDPSAPSVLLTELQFDPKRPLILPTNTGGYIWPSVVALTSHLWEHPEYVVKARRVLELGAGCGLAGLFVANFASEDAHVCLTDNEPGTLAGLRRNVELNAVRATAGRLEVLPLDWDEFLSATLASPVAADSVACEQLGGTGTCGDSSGEAVAAMTVLRDVLACAGAIDLLLGADLIWQDSHGVLVARVARQLLAPGGVFLLVTESGRAGLEAFQHELLKPPDGTDKPMFHVSRIEGMSVREASALCALGDANHDIEEHCVIFECRAL